MSIGLISGVMSEYMERRGVSPDHCRAIQSPQDGSIAIFGSTIQTELAIQYLKRLFYSTECKFNYSHSPSESKDNVWLVRTDGKLFEYVIKTRLLSV